MKNNMDTYSYKSYIIGFVLSLLLTLASYEVVVGHLFSVEGTYLAVVVLALAQFIVQVIFFLHLTSESKPRWNAVSFAFTLIITFILVAGSLWVMYNLNHNMM